MKFIHPTYIIRHSCGCTVTKQVLEATENKRQTVVKMMASRPCLACTQAQRKAS